MPSTVGVADSPAWVLDTNAVLDWLVFRDPACASWTERMVSGSVRWLVIPAMRDELNHVLARSAARGWNADLRALWSAWERLSHSADLLPLAGALEMPLKTKPR